MKYILILFVFFQFPFISNGQSYETDDIITIWTENKQFFSGILINITNDSVFMVDTELGRLAFSKDKIKKIYEGFIPLHFQETTNSSVPYYVQSAIPNGKGNHYYKNYYLFANEFNFGASDHLNLSLGFETFSLIFDNGDQYPIMQLGLKYSTATSETLHIGFSAKYYFNNNGSALLLGTPITLGNTRTSFTISPNYIYSDGSESFGMFSNLSLSMGKRVRFVIDYIYIDEYSIIPVVFEIQFKSGFSLSIGGTITSDGSGPNLGFSIPFGDWKKKYSKN